MKTLNELINDKIKIFGLTSKEAENFVCQEIIIKKISESPFVDNVLLKGGVVMFIMTKNKRRVTSDLDFDLIRYDISSEQSIKNFVYSLNKYLPEYHVDYLKSEKLHQQDYHGVRLFVKITDLSKKILKFKIDIGVHTLFAIKQIDSIFEFGFEGDSVVVKVNPPEQIIAEKIYALAKIGPVSVRYKDIFDVYYIVRNSNPDRKLVEKCLELLTINSYFDLKDSEDVIQRVNDILYDDYFVTNLSKSNSDWIDISYNEIRKVILDYLNK